MAPLNAAGKAALEAFFKGKRGQRQLVTTSAVALTDYFALRGTPLEDFNQVNSYSDPVRPDGCTCG